MVTVRGTNGADTIYQDDYGYELDIYGYDGNDRIYLNVDDYDHGGWNFVDAGAGDDRVYNVYEGGNDIDLGAGNDYYVSIGFATSPNYYDIVYGGTGNDTFEVSTFHSDYYGEDGNDTFYSAGFNNLFDGGSGTDVVSYELQDDDPDLAGYGVFVDLGNGYSYTRGTDFEEILVSIENAVGSGASDVIYGSAGANRLWGSAGNDYINGDSGNDRLYGEDGNDRLYGGGGNDILSGGSGNDRLYGNSGNDILSGGSGSDRFVFNSTLSATSNVDQITDFNVADDTIELDNAIFTRLGADGALSSSMFVNNTTGMARDSNDYILYDNTSGELFYDSNGSANGGRVLFAELDAGLALTYRDFLVV